MGEPDLTNRYLGKIVSLEFLGVLFAVGIAWGTLASNVKALDEKSDNHAVHHDKDIKELKGEQSANTRALQTATGKIILIENNLQHLKEAQEIAQKQQKQDSKEILDLLRNIEK